MKLIFISMLFFSLSGCASRGVNTTIFLVEKNYRLYNAKNEDCAVSGYQVKRDEGNKERYKLTTYFSNCDTWETRYLEEFELKQWILPKDNKRKTNGSRRNI